MIKRATNEPIVVRNKPSGPYADTALCKFLTKQIHALSRLKNQREIAAEIGYDRPNMLSMIKSGDAKLPLDKVPALAKALGVDARHLFRLTLEQHHPEVARVAHEIFGHVVSDNEMALVQIFRKITGDADPQLEPLLHELIKEAFKSRRRRE